VWNLAIPYLQITSTLASAYLLDLVGVTSIREGYLLIIPNGTFEVADACSGMRFQLVGITLALIHTQLVRVPVWAAASYVVLASLLALISNVLRILIVVVIGYHYGMSHEYVQDHNFIGWSIFSIFFFLFLFFGEKWLRGRRVELPAVENAQQVKRSTAQKLTGAAIAVLAFSLGPILYGYFTYRDYASNNNEILVLSQLPGWRMISDQLSDWNPVWTQGEQTLQGRFMHEDEKVDLFATNFVRQRQGHEAVNISHNVYDIEKWSRISRSARVVKVSEALEVTIEETLLKSSGQRQRLVWQWYRTNDKIVASKIQAKLNNLFGVITGKPDITVFVLSKEITKNQSHAAGVLERFLKAYVKHSGGIS
jgi:EpsI family protein